MSEISEMLLQEGFRIIDKRYVCAGHFDKPLAHLDKHAKEILLIAEKSG